MQKEIIRQIVHAIFGTIIIAMLFLGKDYALLMSSFAFGFGIIVSVLSSKGRKIPFFTTALENLGRGSENIAGIGALTLFLGITMAIAFFPLKAALGALVVLSYGDAASTIFGILLGRNKSIGKRTIEGTVAGIIISFAGLYLLFNPFSAFCAAAVGMLAEYLPIDDNISIPIASGIVLSFLI